MYGRGNENRQFKNKNSPSDDHLRQKIILIVNMKLDDPETEYNKAVMELKQLKDLLKYGEKKKETGGRLLGKVTPMFNKKEFCSMVEQAKYHIHEGDIFQGQMWKLRELHRKRWSNWKRVCFIPFPWQERGLEEKQRKKAKNLKRNCLWMKKSLRNTICW